MPDPAIRIRGLSKAYSITHDRQRATNLAEAVTQKFRSPFRRTEKETFWALKDIDLDIERGEVVGVIGRNGAGKSTLLKVLSRITEPTSGRIELFGRVGSLLEVGTGFHPELTGRENIYLNGAILGMKRSEITRQFDAIVDFAGVERFLDTPVKRYSSGMYVRLAFAVAAHLNPEILIVDEVLAVGDAEFQKKCLGKMQDVAESGRTVLFVSHSMAAVQHLCHTAVFISSGRVKEHGHSSKVVHQYLLHGRSAEGEPIPHRAGGTGEFRVFACTSSKPVFMPNEVKLFHIDIERHSQTVPMYRVRLSIRDDSGANIAEVDSRFHNIWGEDCPMSRCTFSFKTPWLKPGTYRVDVHLHSATLLDSVEDACHFEVADIFPYPGVGKFSDLQSTPFPSDFDVEIHSLAQIAT